MTVSNNISDLLKPDLNEVYIETGKEYPPEYPLVFNVMDMETNPITNFQVSGLGTMPTKDENAQFDFDDILTGGSKTYTAVPYGLAVSISWEAWRDELYGVMREMVRCIARAGRHREETAAWSVFNNAFSTSYVGFTASESLCSTSHTGMDGVTRSNRPNPDIGLSITGIQAAELNFEDMTDERNLPRLLAPSMLIIGSTNKMIAREIFGSSGKPYSSDFEINALVDSDYSYMVCHYLTTKTNWFMGARKGEHDANFYWRDRPIFDMFDDPLTKGVIASGYQRHVSGYNTWRGWYGSNA